MPAGALAVEEDLGEFSQFVPTVSTPAPDEGLGEFSQFVPPPDSTAAFVAPDTTDLGEFDKFVPKSPVGETEKALVETPVVPTVTLDSPLPRASQGERPPLAETIAGWLDSFANTVSGGRSGPDTLTKLVKSSTYVPEPGEPSFTNAGIPTIPQQEGAVAETAAGLANVPIGFANFLLSPGGVATMHALGMAPKLAQTLVGVGFTAEQAHQFLNAETTQEKITSGVGASLLGLGTAAGAIKGRGETTTTELPVATNLVERAPQSLETKLPVASESPPEPRTPAAEINAVLNKEVTPDLIAAAEGKPGASTEAAASILEPSGLEGGPGAASSRAKLASYEQRRFGERFQKTEGINPEIREETGNRYYEPIPNKITISDASKIIDERGTDEAIRLVRDENFTMEPRVRSTLAQGLIQKLNQSHAEALAAKDAPKAQSFLDQAVDTAEYLSEFGTRLGQGVQSFAIWSRLTPEGMLESAKRTATRAGVELTPEQAAEIRRLSAEAHAAPEGIPQQDAMKKLANYMVDKTGLPAKDLPLAIYYTHILSGVNTHLVNTVDTALNVWHEANNMAISNPRAASSIYAGLMRGIGEGKYDALMALSEGRRITAGKFVESPDLLEVSQFGKKGGVPIAKTSKIAAATKRIAESRFSKPLNAYKYVMRMMSASDSVSFRGAEEARAGLLAFRMAEARGVQERASIKKEIDSILGFDRLPEFRKQAGKEGYTGSKAEARATELMVQSRPEEIRNDAADFAGIATYNHEPRGMLGYFANAVGRASNQYPVLKLFVPFTRIVANVTNRGLDNTPIGIYRALHGGKSGLAGETKQQVLTRAIAGTAGLAGLGMLNASGVIQVHGAGPSDRERKRQLRAAGWKPFSIQVGDHYFTYTYSPVGLGTSVLGNYLDSQRYNELSQKDAQTRLAYSVSRVGSTVFSQSFLSGLSNLFEILSGNPGQSISSLKRFFSSTVTAVTTPNLVRDVNAIFDPTARKSDNIAQDLVRNIPVIRLGLKPTLNAYGEPVILSRNRFLSTRSDDPAWRVVVNKNLRIPVADQTTFESPDDGYEYARISGERMKKYVLSHISRLESATNDKAQDMLTKASRDIFDDTRSSIIYRRGAVRRARKPRR